MSQYHPSPPTMPWLTRNSSPASTTHLSWSARRKWAMATSIWCLKCSIVRASAGRSSNRPCPTCAASANHDGALTLDRARLEAQTLVAHYQHSPQHTVKIHHFDPELAVMVMEDLSDHRIWRGELIANVYYPQAALQRRLSGAGVVSHQRFLPPSPREKGAGGAVY